MDNRKGCFRFRKSLNSYLHLGLLVQHPVTQTNATCGNEGLGQAIPCLIWAECRSQSAAVHLLLHPPPWLCGTLSKDKLREDGASLPLGKASLGKQGPCPLGWAATKMLALPPNPSKGTVLKITEHRILSKNHGKIISYEQSEPWFSKNDNKYN